jgi:peptidoglycan/LPS O-acetylase OafA/YrhL
MVNVFGPGTGYGVIGLTSLAVVVTALGDDQRWTGLSARPLVWLGERSYSLYLVHVPVFMYVNQLLAGVAPELRVSTAVLVSLALSAALFRYVEHPLRYGFDRRRVTGTALPSRSAVRGLLGLGPKLPA